MTGDKGYIVAQWPELLRDRIDQVLVIAHGKIRTPDAALKENVADDGKLAGPMEENHVAGRMAGAVDDLQRQIAHSNGVAIFEPAVGFENLTVCLLYTSPSPRDRQKSRMPSSA